MRGGWEIRGNIDKKKRILWREWIRNKENGGMKRNYVEKKKKEGGELRRKWGEKKKE